MWLCALSLLWLVPVVAYRRARRANCPHAFCAAGIAFGIVASPASMGTYGLYWLAGEIGLAAFPLALVGILGLALAMLHGASGFYLATRLGLTSPEAAVRGIGLAYTEFLDAVVWAVVYGLLGYVLDFILRKPLQNPVASLLRERGQG